MSFPVHLIPHAVHLLGEMFESVQKDLAESRADKERKKLEAHQALLKFGVPVPHPQQNSPAPSADDLQPVLNRLGLPVSRSRTGALKRPAPDELRHALSRLEHASDQFVRDMRCRRCGEATVLSMPGGKLMCAHCGADVVGPEATG